VGGGETLLRWGQAVSDDLPMWTVYDHPRDFPDAFVARLWKVGRGGRPVATGQTVVSHDIEIIRGAFRDAGLTCLPRQEADDPKIVEVWL
jgi:hypothetical protein